MTLYLNTATNEYPRHDGDLELLGWAIGEPLPTDWVQVLETPAPAVQEGQIAYEDSPKKVDGVWTRSWIVKNKTAEELARPPIQDDYLVTD